METVTSEDEKENYIIEDDTIIEDVIEYVMGDAMDSQDEDNNTVPLTKSNEDDSSYDGPVIIVTSSLKLNEPQIIDNVQFPIDKSKEFLIGRNKEAAIDIKHEAISRSHCLIGFNKDQAMVKNLSSLGMSVNNEYIKRKNQICSLNNGDKIILSKYLPEFVIKFYDNNSHIPAEEMKILAENMSILNKKRKKDNTFDSENVGDAKRCRQHYQNKRQELQQEKIHLETSFSERMSSARKSYDTQIEDINSNRTDRLTDDVIKRIKEELEQNFEAEKKLIESEYTKQMEKWKSEMEAENEKLKIDIMETKKKMKMEMESETKKLMNQVTTTSEELNMKMKENEELKDKLKIAEELIQIGQKELLRESESKREIIEQAKQELEEAHKSKQEALKKCLENENMKNYLQESNEQLKNSYAQKIDELYSTKLDLEKQIEARLNEKNNESETIINQLSNELDSVRELLTIHENERQVLESEVQTKVADFAEVLESEAQCTICSEIFINAITLLGCMHTFCEFCITEWKKQKLECPICRHKIAKNQEKRNILIDSWIASFIEKMSPAIKANRQEVIKIRAQQAQIPINSPRPRPSSTSSRTAGPVVQSPVPGTSQVIGPLAVLHQALQNHVQLQHQQRVSRRASRRGTRVNQRGGGPGINIVQDPVVISSPLNVNAPTFHPSTSTASNNSVIVVTNSGRNDPIIVNQDPIYIGEPVPVRPAPVVPRNANPIVISDEE